MHSCGRASALRRAAKTDRNHAEVMAALRKAGAEVTSLHGVGQGVPDLLASYRGQWFLIEVKDGKKAPSDRALTPDQKKWIDKQNAPVSVVETVEAALKSIGAISDWRIALGDEVDKAGG